MVTKICELEILECFVHRNEGCAKSLLLALVSLEAVRKKVTADITTTSKIVSLKCYCKPPLIT